MIRLWLARMHAWTGIILSFILLLVSVSGSLLLWKDDYLRWRFPMAAQAFEPTPQTVLPVAEAVASEVDTNDLMRFLLPTERLALARVDVWPDDYRYLDVQGREVQRWQGTARPEEWLYELHHRLLMGNQGLRLLGFSALLMLVLVMTGLVLWWPQRRAFWQNLWPRRLSRQALGRSHRHLGALLALPLSAILFSGVVLVFPETVEDWWLGELRRSEDYSLQMMEGMDSLSGAEAGQLPMALERAQASFPDARLRSLQLPGPLATYHVIGLQPEGQWHPQGMSRVYIDAWEGYMDVRIDSQTLPWQERAYQALYPLHTGQTGSRLYQLVMTVLGLGISLLALAGMLGFLRRLS